MAGTADDLAIVVPHTGSVSMRWAVRLAELSAPPHRIVTKSTAGIDLALWVVEREWGREVAFEVENALEYERSTDVYRSDG